MNKFLFCFLILPTIVFSQSIDTQESLVVNKPIVCERIDIVAKWITSPERNQKPFWIGDSKSQESFYGVIVNEKTGSWTIVEFNHEFACILGTGNKNRLTLPMN